MNQTEDILNENRQLRIQLQQSQDVVHALRMGSVDDLRDITERRRVETELHARQNFLNRIFDVLPGVLYIFDLVESSVVFVNNPAALTYTTEEITGMGADMVPNLMHPDDQHGFLKHIARIRTLDSGATATFEYRMKDKAGEWRWYLSTDTVFLRDESGVVRQFIGVASEITNQKLAELALKDSELQSRRDADEVAAIYATAPVGLCVLDKELRYQRINSHLARMNGISAEAHIGKTVREILPEMADELERMARQVFATGEVVANEMSGMTNAEPGILRHWTAQWVPTKDADGVVTGINVVAEEITQRKNAEAALRDSQVRLTRILDQSPAGIVQTDADGRIVLVNNRWCEMLGYSRDTMLGMNIIDITHPSSVASTLETVGRLSIGGPDFEIEKNYRRRDGMMVRCRSNVAALRDPDGNYQGLLAVVLDMTKRLDAEDRLRESDAQLKFSLKAASAGSWDWHIPSDKIFWSPENYNLYDVEPTPAGPAYADWDARVHPDDRQQTNQAVRDVLEGRAAEFRTEFRIVARDGTIRWLAGLGNIERGQDGSPLRLSGINIDITLRKQAEYSLHEINQRQKFLLELSDALRAEPNADAIAKRAIRMLFDQMRLDRCFVGIYRLADGVGQFPYQVNDDRLPTLPAQVRLSDFPEALQVVSDRTLVNNDVKNMEGVSVGERASFASLGVGALIVASLRKGENFPVWAICAVSTAPRIWTSGEVSLVEDVAERTWAAVERARAEERLHVAHDTFRNLIDRSPFGTYIVDADFRMVHMSEGGQTAFGILRPLIGQDFATVVRAVWPDPFGSEIIARFRHTLATGEPYQAVTNERRADIEATEAYDWRIERIILPDGRPGVVCHFYDLTEKQQQEDRIKLLMGEVNHRSKNMLALVQAIARQTVTTQPQDFMERFGERIRGLAANQDLLVKSEWRAVQLDELVRSQLAHFGSNRESQITLDGPPARITASASQSLGMALHELATNAAKYGALSNESGRVAISWNLQADAAGQPQFAMSWIESGGPSVTKPARSGFGSTVIGGMLKISLGCDAQVDFNPTGLVWRINCPAAGLIESDAPPAPRSNGPAMSKEPVLVTGRRILVVEDEALIALDFVQTLSDAGYVVIGPANSVVQALALLARFGCDAAVLDTNLGAETSEPVARALVQRGIPYVAISGYSREQQPEFMQTAPLLGKPIRADMLLAEIVQCLAGSKA